MRGVLANIKSLFPESGSLAKLVRVMSVTIIVIIIGVLIYQTITPANGALMVEASRDSTVYIDGKDIGRTPLEVELSEGEYVIAVVPVTGSPVSYIAKVNVVAGVKTIVRRSFGESSESSSAQVISFEKNSNNVAEIAVVTIPNNVSVMIDGENSGTTPLRTVSAPGEHAVSFGKVGYEDMEIRVNAVAGYTVTVVAELAVAAE